MPVAYRVRPGVLPACPVCSIVGTPQNSLISRPSWVIAGRTTRREQRATGTECLYWLFWGCEHASCCCPNPTQEKPAVETAWCSFAMKQFAEHCAVRHGSAARIGAVAIGLGLVPDVVVPGLMACPKCAEALYADRARPMLYPLPDGRWQISAARGCSHIPDSDKSRADQAEQLANRWNAWAAKRLEERLATDELAPGIKPAFAAAVAAR